MQVKITAMGHTATFQLYNTVAVKAFCDQLPLKLDLTNFRDAQWMFYPPEKLSVTAREAHHDGKKGELSYYEPYHGFRTQQQSGSQGSVCPIAAKHISGELQQQRKNLLSAGETEHHRYPASGCSGRNPSPWGDVAMFDGRFGSAAGCASWGMPYRGASIDVGCPVRYILKKSVPHTGISFTVSPLSLDQQFSLKGQLS
jgi:hypothetical protein